MFELICPHCEATVPASPAKAGGEIACPSCSMNVPVPKLGELKKLPMVDTSASPSDHDTSTRGLSGGRSMAFAMMGAIGLLCFLGSAFCGVNWATIEVPSTTESHLDGLKTTYGKISAARMIREYEDITEYGVNIPQPYPYRSIELRKQAWSNKAFAFGIAGLIAAIIAVLIGRRGTRHAAA